MFTCRCVWVSALLYEVVYGQVSVHHTYTSRVQSCVLKAATKGVFLVSCVCGVEVTDNLHPELLQDVVVLHLYPPPLLGNVAAAHSQAHYFSQLPKHYSVAPS